LWISIIVAAGFVLAYITLGGLSGAIYNEVLQFFVILAGLIPIVIVGLAHVGGWAGLKAAVISTPLGQDAFHSWKGTGLPWSNPLGDWIGIVFGLGFVLSFGYWTTNFAEVQRALSAKDLSAGQRTPLIGAYPKIFIPFLTIIPGLIALVMVPHLGGTGNLPYNDAIPLLMNQFLPNGVLGVAMAGLMAAFMAGMAANVSAFNTVFSYDLWQTYVKKDRPDGYYLRIGRLATVAATIIAIGTALIASGYSNLMDYLQTLFGFFNAPLFATFIVGMFWKRMTATAGWTGLVSGTLAAVVVAVLSEDSLGSASVGVLPLSGQGASFVAAGAAFVVDVIVSVLVSQVTQPKPVRELAGLVYSETPKEDRTDPDAHRLPWYQSPTKLAGISLVLVIILNVVFR
jgi:SSS family solute:Na+ symporter